MASGLTANKKLRHKITAAALLVTLGVVYGDIGTSPLYVMKSIIAGNGGMGHFDTDFLVGSVSLIFWTLRCERITTVKVGSLHFTPWFGSGRGGLYCQR